MSLPVAALLALAPPADQPAAAPPPAPAAERDNRFRGAPRLGSSDGWSIKPRGRLQYDIGHVERPAGAARHRLRLGRFPAPRPLRGRGTMPGGFGFAIDLENRRRQ